MSYDIIIRKFKKLKKYNMKNYYILLFVQDKTKFTGSGQLGKAIWDSTLLGLSILFFLIIAE